MKELSHKKQVITGSRFEFGKNWQSFLKNLNDGRIIAAKKSLMDMLDCEDLKDKTFLDIGCGSGLFSLVARQLGAKVHSFDFDPSSVACTQELKRRYFSEDTDWVIQEASVLDKIYMESLDKFDIVYSWGVLHHTGKMWEALENAILPIQDKGKLFVAIYNDQGRTSKIWAQIKKVYNSSSIGKYFVTFIGVFYFGSRKFLADIVRMKNPFTSYNSYKKERGMSVLHDWIDWLGGYPFEVATPEQMFYFYKQKGFQLEKMSTQQSLGCNEFVFKK